MLLTIPEVAQILGVTTNYAYRLAQRNLFPTFRFSRRGIRVPREAFEEWLREQTVWPADVARQQK